jgi:hypothetical protein
MNATDNATLPTPQEAMAAWGQQPMALALRNMSAMLRAAESINTLQLHATHTARAWHERAEDQVETAKEGLDLTAMQSDFFQQEAVEVGSYWQNLFEVFARLQSDMLNAWQPTIDHATDHAPDAAQAMHAMGVPQQRSAKRPAKLAEQRRSRGAKRVHA